VHILKGLEGCVKPGEMLAIIGGSGAGKSTLLDILSLRKNTGEVTGSVKFNGVDGANLDVFMRRVSGYVTQEDIMNATLTVRETLQFQADLRLSHKLFTKEQREQRVEQVMKDLAIDHRADMRIGDTEKRGLSGGEKKRVAIGVQLVTDPSILYLDEPTSGLDSYNSLAVIRLLRKLAERGKTIITTVHQPRSTIFDLFDRLLVLNFGQTVYLGPAKEISPYLAKYGFVIPNNMNPADYVIDVLLDPNRADFTTADVSNLDFAKSFQESEENGVLQESIKFTNSSYPHLEDSKGMSPYATSVFVQFHHLARRHLRTLLRSPLSSIVQIAQALVLAFIIGSIFYQLGYIAPQDVQGRVGVLFFVMINGAFAQSFSVGAFIEERLLINRERASGVYSAGPYFLSRVLVDTPFQILQIIAFGTIMYWMSALNPLADRFFLYIALILGNGLCAAAFYSFIGSFAPNADVGGILAPILTVLFFLFAGFFINADSIPDWWIWVYWISFFRYTYPGMMNNEFRDSVFFCGNTSIPLDVCNTTGTEILEEYAIPTDADWVWQCILILLAWLLFYRLLSFLFIRFLHKETR